MAGIAEALAVVPEDQACRRFCHEVLRAARRWGPAEQRVLVDHLHLVLQRLFAWLSLGNPGLDEALLRAFHPKGPLVAHLAAWGAPSFVFPLRRMPARVNLAVVLASSDGPSPLTAFGNAISASLLGGATSVGFRGGSTGGVGIGGVVGGRGLSADFGSGWFGLLGRPRLARTATGEVEGVQLTAQEYLLTCFVHYVVCSPATGGWPAPRPGGLGGASANGFGGGGLGTASGAGAFGATGSGYGAASASANFGQNYSAGGAVGSTAGFGPAGGVTGGGGFGYTGAAGARIQRPGSISVAYERLLLANLRAHLQHSEYELAYAHEPPMARFLLHLLHEFLLAPHLPDEVSPSRARADGRLNASAPLSQDPRAQPGALHAARLVAVHVLANPAFRQGCEETMSVGQGGGSRGSGRAARLTREVALLGPPLARFVEEVLARLTEQKQAGLDVLTSLSKLWLVLLQPWKAPRLYAYYTLVRDPEQKLEAPKDGALGAGYGYASGMGAAASAATGKCLPNLDVALVGIEPEAASLPGTEPAPPLLPTGSYSTALGEQPAPSLVGFGGGAATGMVPPTSISLVPGAGNANSWRSYIESFQGVYSMLEAVLSTPLHEQLCLQLCLHLAGPEAVAAPADGGTGPVADSGDAAAAAVHATPSRTVVDGRTPQKAQELVRQPHIMKALKTLAQILLCFTDAELCSALSSSQFQHVGDAAPGTLRKPLFDDVPGDGHLLKQSLVQLVMLTWAALLATAATAPAWTLSELRPLLHHVSRQLQHTDVWARHRLPALEDTEKHKPFAIEVCRSMDRPRPEFFRSGEPASPAFGLPSNACDAAFKGSEWQRPVRGGEWEPLLQLAYFVAYAIDMLLGRPPRHASCGPVPQTEWPRMFANSYLLSFVLVSLLTAIFW